MGQILQEKETLIPYNPLERQGGRTLAEELETQQKFAIEKFKKEYCPLCKNMAECTPLFDLHGNCWGYAH